MSSDSLDSDGEEKLWYVLKVQTNRERTIRDALLKKIRLEGLEDFFGEIMIPSEKVVDTRSGKAREQDRHETQPCQPYTLEQQSRCPE